MINKVPYSLNSKANNTTTLEEIFNSNQHKAKRAIYDKIEKDLSRSKWQKLLRSPKAWLYVAVIALLPVIYSIIAGTWVSGNLIFVVLSIFGLFNYWLDVKFGKTK